MNHRNPSKDISIPLMLLKALAISWSITMVGTAIVALMLYTERMDEQVITPAAVIIMMIAAFVTAIVTGSNKEGGKLLICLGGGLVYFASAIGCNALFFDGHYQGVLGALLAIMGCSLVGALLHSRQKRQRPAYMKRLPK